MRFRKIFLSVFLLSVLFFLLPAVLYSLFSKYYGMEPPFKIYQQDLTYLLYLQVFQAALFLAVFALAVYRRRDKAMSIACLTATLLYLLAEFSPKLVHAFTFHYLSSLYLKISLVAGLLCYLIGGLILGKIFKEDKTKIRF